MKLTRLLPLLIALSGVTAFAQQPEWIWSAQNAADNEVRYFRKEFALDEVPATAKLSATCDNEGTYYLNGKELGSTSEWETPLRVGVEQFLKKGPNVLAIRGKNHTGIAAVSAKLEMKVGADGKLTISTDPSWSASGTAADGWLMPGFKAEGWTASVSVAKAGAGPWGNVMGGADGNSAPSLTTDSDELAVPEGFQVQRVMEADKLKHGSWVGMAKDPQGRLTIGSQTGDLITRLTIKDGHVQKAENLQLPISQPMGMLYAFDSLYVSGLKTDADGKKNWGVFRCKSSDGDHFDKIELIHSWQGGDEHGPHALLLGPDGKIYSVNGNFVNTPAPNPSSPHRNYEDDQILTRAEDGNGFGAGLKPPGGFIMRMDPDGSNAQLFAAGERNTYDIAFNADGELFGFDSDMEWDWGTPWYRPIRIFHAVSGADQGFREGSGKWPEYYADSLPAVVNIGIGCPTGVLFGTGAKFPAKYQKALYVMDWTYGRLIAAHLKPSGASYTATWENFVAPKSLHGEGRKAPVNLTDMVVGDDGALYFIIGGRGTQSALYRVVYTGSESTAPADLREKDGSEARARRHMLEAFHGKQDPTAVATVWPYLGDGDRHLRYAARIAMESQPVSEWQAKAVAEKNPETALTALLALARLGGKEAQPALFTALGSLPMAKLTETQQLEKLRIMEVSIARNGAPDEAAVKSVIAELSPLYPAASIAMNRELCQILLALNAPGTVAKTVALLAAAPTQEEQLTYLLYLRNVRTDWTPETRRAYFNVWMHRQKAQPDYITRWFQEAGRGYGDGASLPAYLDHMHLDAEKTLTSEEIDQLQNVLTAYIPSSQRAVRKGEKPRAFTKVWTVADLEPSLAEASSGRNFENGRDAYAGAQCILCHRFGDEGGAVGPDLTSIAARFSRHDILESIIDPSKVVSEQYTNAQFTLKNGDVVIGRVISEDDQKAVVRPSLLAPETQEVKKSDIASRENSPVSPMPPALLSMMTKEDVLDLIAYMESGGKKDAPQFQAK